MAPASAFSVIRIGIIGSRFAAGLHAEAFRFLAAAQVVAAASPNEAHVRAFAQRHAIPHAYTDYRQLLQRDDIDMITIACPNYLHCQVTLDAARAGKHVVCEKPLAMNLEQADHMIEACQQAGVKLMYAENLCFAPKYVRAKELADEGALGDIYYVRQLECHYGPHSDWFWDVDKSGGGVLMDMGCHSIQFARWLYGNAPVEWVYAALGTFVHQGRTRGDDHSLVVLGFQGGRLAMAENSWARPGGLDDRAEVYGAKGLTVADLSRETGLKTYSEAGYGYALEKAPGTQGWTFTMYQEGWQYGYPQEMQHFVDCLRDDRPPLLTGEDGRAVLEIICAAYASASSGRRVALPFRPKVDKPIDLWLGHP